MKIRHHIQVAIAGLMISAGALNAQTLIGLDSTYTNYASKVITVVPVTAGDTISYSINGGSYQTATGDQITLPFNTVSLSVLEAGNPPVTANFTNLTTQYWISSDSASVLVGQTAQPTVFPDSKTFSNFQPINVTVNPPSIGTPTYVSINALGNSDAPFSLVTNSITLPPGNYTLIFKSKSAYQITSALVVKNYTSSYYNSTGYANGNTNSTIGNTNIPVGITGTTGTNGVIQITPLTNTIISAQNPVNATGLYNYNPLQINTNSLTVLSGPYWFTEGQDYFISMSGLSGLYTFKADLRNIPNNDAFSSATVLSLQNTNIGSYYNIYATTQTNETAIAGGSTIWYLLSSQQAGVATFTVNGLSNPDLTLWEGTDITNLTLIKNNQSYAFGINQLVYSNTVICPILTNNTYYLRVDTTTTPGEFSLLSTFAAAPINDNITGATKLDATDNVFDNGEILTYSIIGENINATMEPGENPNNNNTVWYVIYPVVAGYITSTAQTLNLDQSISLTNTVAAQMFTSLSTNISVTSLQAVPQNTYVAAGAPVYICVTGNQSVFNLSAIIIEIPVNDASTNAIALTPSTSPLSYGVYNMHSTATETMEASLGGSYSIWWNLNIPTAGTLVVESTNFPSDLWATFQASQQLTPDIKYPTKALFSTTATNNLMFDMLASRTNIGNINLSFFGVSSNTGPDTATPLTLTTAVTYYNGTVYKYNAPVINNGFNNQSWFSVSAPTNALISAIIAPTNSTLTLFDNLFNPLNNPNPVVAAQSLFVEVGGHEDSSGLSVEFRNIPANDEATNACPLVLGSTEYFYTKYATLNPNDGAGYSDIWCVYDPNQQFGVTNGSGLGITNNTAMSKNIDLYIQPLLNGHPIAVQFYLAGSMVFQTNITEINWPAIPYSLDGTQPLLIRLIAMDSDTDIAIEVQPQSRNDNFSDRFALQLLPIPLNVQGQNLVMYGTHVVCNNQNASIEPNEVSSITLASHDTTPMNNKSLWFQVTAPTTGTFSINAESSPARTQFELTDQPSLITDVSQSIAWNALTSVTHIYPASEIVSFYATQGQTFYIRTDTAQQDAGLNSDFTIYQIPTPVNSGTHYQQPLDGDLISSSFYYKNIYPSTSLVGGYDIQANLFGATRTYDIYGPDFQISQLANYMGTSTEQLRGYPTFQETWFVFTPKHTVTLVPRMQSNFTPIIYYSTQNPITGSTGVKFWAGGPTTFQANQTYYFCIDGLVPPQLTFSGNYTHFQLDASQAGQYNDYPCDPPGIQGLNTDLNADCLHSWPSVFVFSLTNATTVPNVSPDTATALNLSLGNLKSTCNDPLGSFIALSAQDNTSAGDTNATTTTTLTGGAGLTLWWKVVAVENGPITFDTSDSAVPAILKIFPNEDMNSGYIYNGTATLQASLGESFLIGIDSTNGTSGWLALAVSQASPAPANDSIANAIPLNQPTTCGSLIGATTETGESQIGTGSVWYKLFNFSTSAQTLALTLAGTAQFDVLQSADGSLTNSITIASSLSNYTNTLNAGVSYFIRVYGTNQPSSGTFQLLLSADQNWFESQTYITPSTGFTGTMKVEATSIGGLHPIVYYDTAIATTNSSVYGAPILISKSTTYDFLIVTPGQDPFHVTRTYFNLSDLTITPSCAFQGQLLVTASNANFALNYKQGAADGSAPTTTTWTAFPLGGILLNASAEIDVSLVSGLSSSAWVQHYTNTVSQPQFLQQGNNVTVWSTTPNSALSITAGTNTYVYTTNRCSVPISTPVISATAWRSGWLSGNSSYNIASQTLNTNLPAVTIVTNTLNQTSATFTLSKTNSAAVLVFVVSNNQQVVNSGLINANSTTITINGSGVLQAYISQGNFNGPVSTVTYSAKLLTPTFIVQGNTLLVSNRNTVASSLVINSINVGSSPVFTLPLLQGVLTSVYATSAFAANSDVTNYTASISQVITVTPTSGIYTTNQSITISAAAPSSTLYVNQIGTVNNSYSAIGHITIPINTSSEIDISAAQYGVTYAQVTNFYIMQVAPITLQMPPVNNLIYDSSSPVLVGTTTAGAVASYTLDGGTNIFPCNNGLFNLQAGNHTYAITARLTGWLPATNTFQVTAALTAGNLVDYIEPYYTIFPGDPTIPAEITATNQNLVDSYPIMYIHRVWLNGQDPGDAVYISNPVQNLQIYHQVTMTNWSTGEVQQGPVQVSYVSVNFFDWQASDGTLSSDPNISSNIFFFKPTWVTSRVPMTLQAVTPSVAYDLTPLQNPQNPDQYLIPGNLNSSSSSITLRYKPVGTTAAWKTFAMQFRTIPPFVSVSNNIATIAVSPEYTGQPVSVYYTTDFSAPSDQPYPNILSLTNGVATVSVASIINGSTNQWWLLNSKYKGVDISQYLTNTISVLPQVKL